MLAFFRQQRKFVGIMRADEHKGIVEQTAVVILAAGKGTRMGKPDLAKVCFEIDGVPAINRVISTFKERGFSGFLVVVGHEADQVIGAVPKKQIVEKLQLRAAEVPTHAFLGQYNNAMAIRKNVTGSVVSPVPVFWNIEKK